MNIPTLVRAVESYMRSCMTRYIDELRTLCAIDAGSFYKVGLDEIAYYLAQRMSALGMKTIVSDHERWGNDVQGSLEGNGSGRIVLVGHTDTVYPVGTASAYPLRLQENVISAPGAADMKGGILCALYAIEALLALQCCSFGEICVLCVSDEEISQRHSEDLLRQTCQGSRAVFVLEAGRANGDIVSARKGTAWYTLHAYGKSAHAGVEPEKGRNAIMEIAQRIPEFASLHSSLPGLCICPGVISGGTTPNVVPDYALARFDLRYLHPQDRVSIEQKWQDMLQYVHVPEVKVQLEREAYRDPMVCTRECNLLVDRAQEIASYLGFSLHHTLAGGTSDGCYASALNVPVLDGLGPIGGLDHSPCEYILLDSIISRTALLAGLIAITGISPILEDGRKEI